jgi:hypothetical protein
MADQKLSQLTAATLPLAGTELAYLVQGGAERRATALAIATTLPEATTSTAGKLSAADKIKLDSITAEQATIVRRWVRNETGSTIAKGIPVYISASNGVTPTVIPADASTEETAARTIGLTQAAINHQAYGWVIEVGRLDGINTSTLTEGQIIWLSETTGQMTSIRPTQPAHGVILGYCVKQGGGSSGIVDVKVDNGLELAELHDVLLTGAATGDVLALASDGLWKKRTLGSAAASATGDFAPAAQGVTNGSNHNHDGGDGAQIAYSSLSGLPGNFTSGAAGLVPASGSGTLNFLRADGTFAAPPGGGTKTLARFTVRDNQPPASGFATLDTRNSVSVLEFDAATEESAAWISVIPEGGNLTSGLLVRIWWMADTATSGNVRWAASFERSGTDLDADSFDAATEVTSAANGTSGIETVAEITCTAIDSLAAGERFRLRIARKAADATNDTMTGDAQIVAVEVRGVA